MALSANLGLPRIGLRRELKTALESYWAGRIDQNALQEAARTIRLNQWTLQKEMGIDHIPSNDFSFYDHVLDTACMLGCVPARFNFKGPAVDLDTYFAMARGDEEAPAMEMTKWFDTNYHYIVPEFESGQSFSLASSKVIDEFLEAREHGALTRPVLLGPVSFLMLGKAKHPSVRPLDLLNCVLPLYAAVIEQLEQAGAEWVQIDEPALVLDLDDTATDAFKEAYAYLAQNKARMSICLTTYFGTLGPNLDWALRLPVEAVHLDLVRAPQQLDDALKQVPEATMLSLGVVNGRNIWKADLTAALEQVDRAVAAIGSERIMLAPSCSLLHSPVDLDVEEQLPAGLRERLSFARQKLEELSLITRAARESSDAIASELKTNQELFAKQRNSPEGQNADVQKRLASLSEDMFHRRSPFAERKAARQLNRELPLLPTTTIGSFPQTRQIRKARWDFKKGLLKEAEYRTLMQHEINQVIQFQERVGLDVLVHGEPERNDMVEYFGQLLDGVAFTQNGWVQSYGSRCVKPPIIHADVSRPEPMTVDWTRYAQCQTTRPVKGMLTGPITILQWSFVREDQPRRDTANQLALCIRDEARDLEAAGTRIVQIDEPALREGLPLRGSDWPAYLDWAVNAFRLATSGVSDQTQIHTHMCYCDFNTIIEAIAQLDADVISIEASRSDAELLDAFADYKYPNEIGPGVYDIHSPRVPSVEEVMALLEKMSDVLDIEQLWVNPDCGLKTRQWPEVEASLTNMVVAARRLRECVAKLQ